MKSVLGSELPADQQRRALAVYVHRYTRNHKPRWAHGEWKDGKPYPLQFDSDADWLAHTRFCVTNAGTLASGDCYSQPTWPDNPELRKVAAS